MATTTKSIYVETSIFSFLCAEPSMVLVTAARQRDTHSWWNHHRMKYRIFTSSEVLAEAGDGDTEFASKLLTWNLRHLANPATLPFVYDYLRQSGRHRPIITTPSDLLGSQ